MHYQVSSSAVSDHTSSFNLRDKLLQIFEDDAEEGNHHEILDMLADSSEEHTKTGEVSAKSNKTHERFKQAAPAAAALDPELAQFVASLGSNIGIGFLCCLVGWATLLLSLSLSSSFIISLFSFLSLVQSLSAFICLFC